jgi:hypothetical protein
MRRILAVQSFGMIGKRRSGGFVCVCGNQRPTPPTEITEQTAEFFLIQRFDECPHLCIGATRIDRLIETVSIQHQERHADV